MARIVLVTYGTQGDVLPVLSLAAGLRRAGHDAEVFGPPDTVERAAWQGVPYTAFGQSMQAAIARAGDAARTRVDSNENAFAFLRRQIAEQLESLPAQIGAPDLIIAATLAWGAASIAQRAKVAYRYLAYTPQAIPSRRYPPPVSRRPGAPAWAHALSWRMYLGAVDLGFKKVINPWREREGLAAVERVWPHVIGARVLLACDEVFGSHPAAGTPACVQVGFLPSPRRSPHQLSEGLEAFLAAGDAPIYAGFGSMPGSARSRVMSELLAGARAAGRRLVLGGGWPTGAEHERGDDVLTLGYEPFDLLFERVAAVVHHGGAGTVATAARAGVAQIIVPHLGDQFFFADRIAALGLGPAPIPARRFRARKLHRALDRIEAEPAIRRTAAELAARLRETDGVQRAVEAVEAELAIA